MLMVFSGDVPGGDAVAAGSSGAPVHSLCVSAGNPFFDWLPFNQSFVKYDTAARRVAARTSLHGFLFIPLPVTARSRFSNGPTPSRLLTTF